MDDTKVLDFEFFTEDECNKLIEYCHKKEEEFIKINHENKNSFGGRITTEFYDHYNFFVDNQEYIDRFKKVLSENFPELKYPLFVQSWVNIYRKGEGIGWHQHYLLEDVYIKAMTANIFLGGNVNHGVIYLLFDSTTQSSKPVKHKNKIGNIHFVDSRMWHMVEENPYDQNRYSVGITISEYDQIWEQKVKSGEINCPAIIITKD